MGRLVLMLLMFIVPVSPQTRELDITPGTDWVDSGVDLAVGDTVKVTATGELQYANAKQSNGPEGLPRAFTDMIRIMPMNDAGRGALIGRIGNSDAARPFLLGANGSREARIAGRLFLAVNQPASDQVTGSYHVRLERTASAAPAAPQHEVQVPAFSQSLLDSIPRRVSDPNGAPGDRVNFILIGSQEQVQAVLKAGRLGGR